MKKTLVLMSVLALSGVAIAEDAATKGNICSTESVEAQKGTSFPVKVLLANVDTLIAIQVPIYYRSENIDLICDSISFTGTRLQDQTLSFFRLEPVGKVAFFAFMSMVQIDTAKHMLEPGTGPIAVMWFTAKKDIKSGKVTLESGPNAYMPHEYVDYSYHFWTRTLEDLTKDVDCAFSPGYITVK